MLRHSEEREADAATAVVVAQTPSGVADPVVSSVVDTATARLSAPPVSIASDDSDDSPSTPDDVLSLVLSNDDLLCRIMECVGPRRVRLGIGSSSRRMRAISGSNELWKKFWRVRSLECRERPLSHSDDNASTKCDDAVVVVHDAARMFREAEEDILRLACEVPATGVGEVDTSATTAAVARGANDHGVYFEAYVRLHYLLKLTNLRPKKKVAAAASVGIVVPELRQPCHRGTHDARTHEMDQSLNLVQAQCTQTWLGLLSTPIGNREIPGSSVTCNNAAESWCDFPTCHTARCGRNKCLRAYRFGGGVRSNGCEESEFVRCSWCSASFCLSHAAAAIVRPPGDNSDAGGCSWTRCDDCHQSACSPACAAEVFLARPVRCTLVHGGRRCYRWSCVDACAKRVGRKEGSRVAVEPFGTDYLSSSSSPEVYGLQGWREVESCCSSCVDDAVKRIEQVVAIEGAFGGLIP